MKSWKDQLGIAASVTCAIHCAATPFLLATLPALKLTEWMASPYFHQIAAIVCVALVSISIWPTYQRFRDSRILALSTTGICLIVAAAFALPDQCCSHAHLESSAVASSDKTSEVSQASLFVPSSIRLVSHRHDTADQNHDDHDHAGHSHADDSNDTLAHSEHDDPISLQPLLAGLQPWMTPIGGVLLIAAHMLNLRRRRDCGRGDQCC